MGTTCRIVGVLMLVATTPLAAQNLLGNAARPNLTPQSLNTAMRPRSLNPFKAFNLSPKAPTLSQYFPKLSLTPRSWPAKPQATPILDTKNNPFQPNPPKGNNIFSRKPVNLMTP